MLMIIILTIILIGLIISRGDDHKLYPNDLIILILVALGSNAYIWFY